jgi:hypothetical protein
MQASGWSHQRLLKMIMKRIKLATRIATAPGFCLLIGIVEMSEGYPRI